ncbi:MAG: thiamine phosphate synthase, partial [Candidatus Omnitrophica bacterium]|nr:thiamine phosphate synthase [Candidatus Omnitrophota bacterium]
MSNATSCSHWRLYAILDHAAAGGRDLAWLARQAIQGGADVLQLRHKHASTPELLSLAQRLLPIAKAAGIPLIINDRADVALAAGADGVHVGQDDMPV